MKKLLLALLLLYTAQLFAYECDGRTRCSQMHSCDEAKWFTSNCPNTQMDGDNDGVPCERQCGGKHGSGNHSQPRNVTQPESETIGNPSTFDNANVGTDVLQHLFRNKQSGVQVLGSGVVEKILLDDNDGSTHQRFIVRSSSGTTVLVAHNIDLAPRVPDIAVGEKIAFYGVYEWNDLGGVVHWTHHDPQGQHVAGWVRYSGKKYQ